MNEKVFMGITFDYWGKGDVGIDPKLNDWSMVCESCVKHYTIDEKYLDDAGQGTCGVKGCTEEGDYYIDF
jgi:hypothetical protein